MSTSTPTAEPHEPACDGLDAAAGELGLTDQDEGMEGFLHDLMMLAIPPSPQFLGYFGPGDAARHCNEP